MKPLALAMLAALMIADADAGAQGVYVCVQPNGVREYRNTGDTRG